MNDINPTTKSRGDAPVGWLRHEIDRLFDEFGHSARRFARGGGIGPEPAIELIDKEGEYRLTAELPGMKEDDIEVSLADGMLVIKGEKQQEDQREEGSFMLNERRYGAFERQIRLPADANPEQIEAKFKKGVLTLTIAKDEKAPKARKIAVNAE